MHSINLNLVRSINDPIHGSIKLSNDEIKIIEHTLFKRLHFVKQNSFLYKVFPSAKHTRFEHSIGVMHLATKMYNALIENSKIAAQRGDIESNLNNFNNLISEKFEVGVNLYDYFDKNKKEYYNSIKTLRFAALLHDIGHGPLSHLFDSFAPTVDEFMAILETDSVLNKYPEIYEGLKNLLNQYKIKEETKGKIENKVRVEHEHVSLYFIVIILNSIGENVDTIKNVLTILKPEIGLGNCSVSINGFDLDLLKLLNDIVASAPIDCDRMDYLKRDSYFAGVPYGNYSEDRVLKSLLPYANEKELRLGIKLSGLHAIENFLQARYELFVQVYGHKTNEACAAILEFVCNSPDITFESWSKINMEGKDLYKEYQDLYTTLTDESFLKRIKQYFIVQNDNKRVSALKKLENRELWKRIYEIEEFISIDHKDTEVDKAFTSTVAEMKKTHKEIYEFSIERFPLKDLEKGAKLLEKSSKSVYVVSNLKLNNSSQILKSLNYGLRVWRIYGIDNNNMNTYKTYVRSTIQSTIEDAQKKDLELIKQ